MSDPFIVHRFETESRPNKDGGYTFVDWVEYGPKGPASDKVVNRNKVSALINIHDNPTNPASRLAKIRAEVIKKHYDAWKSGQEIPETGTPLSAWNGVTPAQADILRTKKVKTVEDVAGLTDTDMNNIPFMGVRALRDSAKRFLAASDSVKVASELAARDAELERLRAEQDESREQVQELVKLVEELRATKLADALGEAKRGPGRPPKTAAA
jgi:hypothetical protein